MSGGDCYPCDGPMGYMLIINMREERPGADIDMGRLETLARMLRFEIQTCYDRSAVELKTEIKNFANLSAHKVNNSVICFVNAHGGTDEGGDGYILDNKTNKIYVFEDLMMPFLVSKPLRGKPKVFFVNACRGEVDPCVRGKSQNTGHSRMQHNLRDVLDVFTVFSTEIGRQSFRSSDTGSEFVKVFTETVTDNYNKDDVATIMEKLNKKFSEADQTLQIADVHTKLTRKLYWRQNKENDVDEDDQDDSPLLQLVPPQVFGQEQYFDRLKERLLQAREKVFGITGDPIFGVSGMGGIGKTTLAKTIYNDSEIRKHFKNHVYWLPITEKPDVVEKQKALVEFMGGSRPETSEKHSWINQIRIAFKKVTPFLLVLDDVWSTNHIDDILGDPITRVIPPGSACLMTSRVSDALRQLGAAADNMLELDLLNDDDSQSLFCMHAFRGRERPKNLPSIVMKTIKACANLPLMLEVIGAHMFHQISNVHYWRTICDRLERAEELGNDRYTKALEKLKVSYDFLPKDSKDDLQGMFLAFAAFAEGEDLDIADLLPLWNMSKDQVWCPLQQLVSRCMIKEKVERIDRSKRTRYYMHALMRRLAVKIIEERDPCCRKLLFAEHYLLKFPSDWCITQSKCPNHRIDEESYAAEKLTMMRSMFTVIPKEALAFFRRLSHLKVLIICISAIQQLPSELFLYLEELEKLHITNCYLLSSLPAGIKHLKRLQKLELSGCLSLTSFPQEIGEVRSLMELDLSDCSLLSYLPPEIGEVGSLLKLNLSGCGWLRSLPQAICRCTKLKVLNLKNCRRLKSLPSDIVKLQSLKYLDASRTMIEEVPKQIGALQNLEFLSFEGCSKLKLIPPEVGNLSSLTCLNIEGCSSLSNTLRDTLYGGASGKPPPEHWENTLISVTRSLRFLDMVLDRGGREEGKDESTFLDMFMDRGGREEGKDESTSELYRRWKLQLLRVATSEPLRNLEALASFSEFVE